ncbi:MAG: hypothetical protein K2K07_01260 [Lachnospiraceae bacterium]|nr:hypothetical protein [Lachnospiraceae bacterium]
MRLMNHSTVMYRQKQPCSPGNGKKENDGSEYGMTGNVTRMSYKTACVSE